MRQVPGREPDGFASRSFYAGLFALVLYPSLLAIRHFDVPGP